MAPVVAVVAKVVAIVISKLSWTYVVNALIATAVNYGVSRLLAKRSDRGASAGGDGGARVQLPPATVNKLPVIYGTAFIGGSIVDAMLSTDQKTMWYVIALAEVSDDQGGGAGLYLYDTNKCYYDGKQIQFGGNGAVTGLITNTATPQVDTRCNGYLYVYLFDNGSSSCVNYAGQTAQTILSTANGVPAAQAWTATNAMTNCAFAIVKVIYSTDAGMTGAGQLMVNITNTITKPGDAILDYMLNTRYGCALPLDTIDVASLTALNTYSDQLISYIPASGSTTPPLPQQARYRINGPLDTGVNCLDNLQYLVDSCDSWLQYSELTGKWKVVINKLYDSYPDVNPLFSVTSSNLIGGIDVSPITLNETYNQIEVAYPNTNIKDQTDYYIIDLFTEDPQLLSPNEAVNRLNVTLPLVNNAVQARYLAARRIYQSREDLVITFKLDYSGIQLEAGDVIRVTHEVYGWTNKLFRVNNVSEIKDESGNLYANVQAFEYSDGIYADVVQDYVPAFNTGLSDPNVISQPCAPVIVDFTDANALITGFAVESCVPQTGLVLYMDFNYGNTSNVQEHRLYRTIQQSNGAPYINSPNPPTSITKVSIPVNDLQADLYYWSVTARNNTSGRRSNASNSHTWGGANIQPWNANTGNGGIQGTQVRPNTISSNNMTATGVIAGTYTLSTITVDTAGRVTNAATGTVPPSFTIPTGSSPMLIVGPSSGGESSVVEYSHTTTYGLKDISTGLGSGLGIGYLQGTSVSSSYYLPYASGTSDTANLFLATSTAGYGSPGPSGIAAATPALAAIQGPLYASYSSGTPNLGGWALLKEVQVDANYTPAANAYVRCECVVQLWADSDCTVIYGGSYALSRGALNNHYITQDKVGSIKLYQYAPYQLVYNFSYRGGYPTSNPVLSMALWFKNITSGSTVHFLQSSMIISTPYIYGDYLQGFPYAPYA